MKYIYKIIFLSFLVFSINLTLTNNSSAACAVDGNGAITAVAANNGCDDEPSGYGVVAYKLLLCTSAPIAPTTTTATNLSSCVTVFENAAGSSVTLSNGETANLGGTQTMPPPNVYTHGVLHMNNTFAITGKKQFAIAYNGMVSGNGNWCATVSNSGFNSSNVQTTNRSICGDQTITAGTYTETLTSFDTPFSATATINNVAGTGANITAYMIDTNEFLAVNDADSNNLLGVVTFPNPGNVTVDTTIVDVAFRVGEGMNVSNDAAGMYLGSGPFAAVITTN
jgi:hypothetical protein